MIVDRATARRMERADAVHSAAYEASVRLITPETETTVEHIADGMLIYAGKDMPINRVIGLGMDQPVTEAILEEVDGIYREFGAAPQIDLCPMADVSLLAILRAKRYCPLKMYSMLVRAISDQETFGVGEGIEISIPREKRLWVDTVVEGFTGAVDQASWVYHIMRLTFHRTDTIPFLAMLDEEPAGAGAMCVHDGVVMLYSASTIERFRRRGVQTALLNARLKAAREAGCDLAMVLAAPGSDSERNIQRAGFQIGYTKLVFTI